MDVFKKSQTQATENLIRHHKEALALEMRKVKRRQHIHLQRLEDKHSHEVCITLPVKIVIFFL